MKQQDIIWLVPSNQLEVNLNAATADSTRQAVELIERSSRSGNELTIDNEITILTGLHLKAFEPLSCDKFIAQLKKICHQINASENNQSYKQTLLLKLNQYFQDPVVHYDPPTPGNFTFSRKDFFVAFADPNWGLNGPTFDERTRLDAAEKARVDAYEKSQAPSEKRQKIIVANQQTRLQRLNRLAFYYAINNDENIRKQLISYAADLTCPAYDLLKYQFLLKLVALARDFCEEAKNHEIERRNAHQFDQNSLLYHLNRQPLKLMDHLSIKSVDELLIKPNLFGYPTSAARHIAMNQLSGVITRLSLFSCCQKNTTVLSDELSSETTSLLHDNKKNQ